MGVFEDATVTAFVADHIAMDAAQKLTALGAGFMFAGLDAQTGLSAPQHLAVLIDVPGKYSGQQFALGLELRDETTGQVVQVPSPTPGQLDALRVQQIVSVAMPPQVPGATVPDGTPLRSQVVLAFPTGVPLAAGHRYSWRIEIDGQHRPGWKATFAVLGPAPGPVFGGPAGPAAIPNIAPPVAPEE